MSGSVQQIVYDLRWGAQTEKVRAALALRNLAGEVKNKEAIREAGGIEALLELLSSGEDNILTVVCAETISCLAADDSENREAIRKADGIVKLVALLQAGPLAESTHRALLALRIVTDRETDRQAILQARKHVHGKAISHRIVSSLLKPLLWQAGGIPFLVSLLSGGPDSEITEYAAAALGNLAAGGHALKDAIRAAGGIAPLVRLLRDSPDEISAELAAVALRNMALQNSLNREAIIAAGGLQPLLRLLSGGQERLVVPMQCEVVYRDPGTSASCRRFTASQCCFDSRRAELCIAAQADSAIIGCFARPGKHLGPRDKSAERYSLLRKLTLTEPDVDTLEIVFTLADALGAPRVVGSGSSVGAGRRLERVIISPCGATELKGSIMRMLTRTHLEREFRVGRHSKASSVASMSQLSLSRVPSSLAY